MKLLKLESEIKVYDSLDEIGANDRELIRLSLEASNHAYAPYSQFFVGAALRLIDGMITTGSNQENVAYPSGLCAERTAIFSLMHHHPGKAIDTIAISARSEKYDVSKPPIPCGACIQVMAEHQRLHKHPLRILLYGQSGLVYECESLKVLMPLQFNL